MCLDHVLVDCSSFYTAPPQPPILLPSILGASKAEPSEKIMKRANLVSFITDQISPCRLRSKQSL